MPPSGNSTKVVTVQILPTSSQSPFFLPQTKFLEKLAHLQLSSHLNSNNLLFPLQSGFRPSHSTQTLLLYCLGLWYKALDKRNFVESSFLTSPRPLTLSPTISCYPSYPVLVSLPLLSPGFNLISRIVATSLDLLTLTPLLASLPLVFLKFLCVCTWSHSLLCIH